MEDFADCQQRLVALQHRAKAQADALKILENALAQEAAHLHRLGQAQCLDALRARVTREMAAIQQKEATESFAFSTVTVIGGFVAFGFGSLWGLLHRTQKHPFAIGAELAEGVLARTQPFDTVMVAVGASGVPDEVNVIPVSQRTREEDQSEYEIVAVIERQGYRVMTPQTFFNALGKLREKVLEGVLTLPIANDSFS